MSFAGLKVISFESRRAAEMAQLIRKQQGEPIVAPSMREAPIERNEEAFRFAERLFAGEFDMMILLTGVGTRFSTRRWPRDILRSGFAEALRRITVVPRGPKPVAALREMNVPVTVMRPSPTPGAKCWQPPKAARSGRIAVQEYGRPSAELIDGLRARGAEVTSVRVYQWDLPEDTGPLREAAERIAAEEVDVALFTTSVQIDHLLRVAAEKGTRRLRPRGFHENAGRLRRPGHHRSARRQRHSSGFRAQPSQDGISGAGDGRPRRSAAESQATEKP